MRVCGSRPPFSAAFPKEFSDHDFEIATDYTLACIEEGILNRGWFAAGAVSLALAGLIPWFGMAAESTAGDEKVAKESQ